MTWIVACSHGTSSPLRQIVLPVSVDIGATIRRGQAAIKRESPSGQRQRRRHRVAPAPHPGRERGRGGLEQPGAFAAWSGIVAAPKVAVSVPTSAS
jgi:hypothetical protein